MPFVAEEACQLTYSFDSTLVLDNEAREQRAKKIGDKPARQWLAEMDSPMRDLYESLRAFILALGYDVKGVKGSSLLLAHLPDSLDWKASWHEPRADLCRIQIPVYGYGC